MPNKDGLGPQHSGARIGRGKGFCNVTISPVEMNKTENQEPAAAQSPVTGCRGPKGCGTGNQTSARRCGGAGHNRRGQR